MNEKDNNKLSLYALLVPKGRYNFHVTKQFIYNLNGLLIVNRDKEMNTFVSRIYEII